MTPQMPSSSSSARIPTQPRSPVTPALPWVDLITAGAARIPWNTLNPFASPAQSNACLQRNIPSLPLQLSTTHLRRNAFSLPSESRPLSSEEHEPAVSPRTSSSFTLPPVPSSSVATAPLRQYRPLLPSSRLPAPMQTFDPHLYLSPPSRPPLPYDATWLGLPAHLCVGPSAIIVGVNGRGPIWAIIEGPGGYPLSGPDFDRERVKACPTPLVQHVDPITVSRSLSSLTPTAILAPNTEHGFRLFNHAGGYPIPVDHPCLRTRV